MEYVSDLMFETGFDLIMLGDAKKYLEKWRQENKEKTDEMISRCQTRSQEKANEEAQKVLRREALRVEVRSISQTLHNQSLVSKQTPLHTKVTENPVLVSTRDDEAKNEDEETAWNSLGASLGSLKKTEVVLDGERKKRAYVKKNQKSETRGASATPKNKE